MAQGDSDFVHLQPGDSRPTDIQSTPTGCYVLPAETIYHILRFLNPQDLIRLQAVSKRFRAIVCDPAVWRTLYATARLPLPPGPFTWQSPRYHQRALVRSAHLARAWTTTPLALTREREFKGPRSIEQDRFKWVRGRWLIVSQDMKALRSRDVETGLQQVLWDHVPFAFWAAASVTSPRGHFMYVAVHLGKGHVADPVKLLEFAVNDDTGYLSGPEILDVPTWTLPREAFIPRIRVDSGMAPYAYISLCSANKPRQSLVFDPQHRRFYKFPRFRTRLDLLLNYRGAWLPHLVEVYFTQTHLFVLNRSYLIHGNVGNVEVIQTFTLPDPDPDPDPTDPHPTSGSNHDSKSALNASGGPVVRELRLTHELLSRDTGSLWLYPIRNAIVDATTGSTTLRFLHTYAPFHHSPQSRVRLVCTDYVLPAPTLPSSACTSTAAPAKDKDKGKGKGTDEGGRRRDRSNGNVVDGSPNVYNASYNAIVRSTADVLPITAVSHDVLSVLGVWSGNLVDASDDGFVRGMCMVGRYTEGSNIPNVGMVLKFALDATGERCVAVVGDACLPWEGLNTSRCYEYSFDGMRGRMWKTKGDVVEMDKTGRPVDKETLALVLDLE